MSPKIVMVDLDKYVPGNWYLFRYPGDEVIGGKFTGYVNIDDAAQAYLRTLPTFRYIVDPVNQMTIHPLTERPCGVPLADALEVVEMTDEEFRKYMPPEFCTRTVDDPEWSSAAAPGYTDKVTFAAV